MRTPVVHAGQVCACLLAASALIYGPTAEAVVLASDSFVTGGNAAAGQYTVGNLRTQNPILPGFSGGWFDGVGETPTDLFSAAEQGLDLPFIGHEAGGSATFNYPDTLGPKQVRRNLTIPGTATGEAIYFSGIMSSSLDSGLNTGTSLFSFVDTSTAGFGIHFGLSNGDVVVRYRTGTNTSSTTTLQDGFEANTPYYFVLKLEINVGEGINSFQDRLSVWLNPVGLGSEAAAGIPTYTDMTAALSNNALDYLELFTDNVSGATISFDEIRVGTTFADVAPVPEPSSIGLGMAAMAGLFGFRRRRVA